MNSTRSFILETAKRFCTMMLFFTFLPLAFAQEMLNEQGEPIPMNPQAEYVANEIIVNFAPETITLPEGRILADIADITVHPQITALIRDAGARQVKKVFRFFTRKDTIRTLESGEKVRVQDLSQVFVLRFPAALDVPALVNRFKNSPRVIHAQPNYIYRIEVNPNDPRFPNQWGLEQTSDEDIDVQPPGTMKREVIQSR